MKENDSRKFNDFGLGEKSHSTGYRAINKDGSFNIVKTNVPFFERINRFHDLVTMPWPKFLAFIAIGYLAVNLLFGGIFYLIGVENLTGMKSVSPSEEFIEAFFFSAQTITTLGYGRVAPIGLAANIVAAIESMLGLMTFALATGLLYGRFSRATSKIKYSDVAVVAPYQNINGFMLRVVNPQKNELVELVADIGVSFSQDNTLKRDFYNLELERSTVNFFPSIWTIVHPIDKDSPLYGLTIEDLAQKDAEFIVMLKAYDEATSQIVYSRTSYKPSEIIWGAKFTYLAERVGNKLHVDVSGLNQFELQELNSY